MPTRVSRRCLLIGPSFAEKRVWFSQVLPNFLQIYVAYTILSRKTCDGEQKLFLRSNLHINAHKCIETIFCWLDRLLLQNVYDLAKNFQIFFKNMLPTLFYIERHVMESKNYFWELIFILMPTRVSRRFLLIGPSFAEKLVWFKNFQIFFKNMLLTLFDLERHVMKSKNYFWELIFMLNAHNGIETIFADWTVFCWKTCMILPRTFKFSTKNILLTLFYLERHVMESKNYFWELIFILMPTRVSRRFLLIGPSFAEICVWCSQVLPNFLQKYVAYTILSRKTCDGEQKLFLRINLHINVYNGIETIFADWTVFCWKTCMI